MSDALQSLLWPTLWQSSLVVLVAVYASIALRKRPAQAHAALVAGLLACVLAPALTFGFRAGGLGVLPDLPQLRADQEQSRTGLTAPSSVNDELETSFLLDDVDATLSHAAQSDRGGNIGSGIPASTGMDTPSDASVTASAWSRLVNGLKARPGAWWLVAGWIVLSILTAGRLLCQVAREIRIVRRSLPVDDPRLHALAGDAAARLGFRCQPGLRVAGSPFGPTAWCFGNCPMVILTPESLATLDDEQLRSVLLHELAHCQRRDHLWQLLGTLILCLLPWQPLLWVARRRMQAAAEESCDALVIHAGSPREAYADTLLRLVTTRRPELTPAVGGPRHRLERRIRALLRDGPPYIPLRPRWKVGLMTLCALSVLLLAAAQPGTLWTMDSRPRPGQIPDQPTTQPERPQLPVMITTEELRSQAPRDVLTVTVVNAEDGGPASEATVRIRTDLREWNATLDHSGRYAIDVSDDRITRVEVNAESTGRVPMQVWWEWHQGRIELPDAFTIALPRGTTIGGRIVSDSSLPIADASVLITALSDRRENPHVWIYRYEVTTDTDGRWRCDIVPEKLNRVSLGIEHPEYVDSWGRSTNDSSPSIAELRALRAVHVLSKGITVTGRVVDRDGRGIVGARVDVRAFTGGTGGQSTTTGEDGVFRLQTHSDDLQLIVSARGHAPEMLRVAESQVQSPIDVRLEDGAVMEGIVTSTGGKPLAGADVIVIDWGGTSHYDWNLRTDDDGRFLWRSAPHEPVKFNVRKNGYVMQRLVELMPGEPAAITLARELFIRGTVTNAETGEAIEVFTATPGYFQPPDESFFWYRTHSVRGHAGEFTVSLDEPHNGVSILVEAEGYLPRRSRTIAADEGMVAADFQLHHGSGPSARVIDTDDRPIAGATVVLTNYHSVEVRDASINFSELVVPTTTDKNGAFSFSAQIEPYAVLILSDDGYLLTTGKQLEEQNELVLQPWSVIEGRFTRGDQPLANERVEMSSFVPRHYNDPRRFRFTEYAVTDGDGRFVFDHVVSGLGEVTWRIPMRRMLPLVSQRVVYDIEAGEVLKLQLGGSGVNVVGHIEPPDGADGSRIWSFGECRLGTPQFEVPYPTAYLAWDHETQRQWYRDWRRTQDALDFSERMWRETKEHWFTLDEDGSFSIDDIAPGEYELFVRIIDPDSVVKGVFGEPMGRLQMTVTIPKVRTAQGEGSIDLGTLPLDMYSALSIGAVVPDFTFATLDGGEQRLAEFRGKYVLLDFWATWCGPCLEEMPNMKAVHERYGADPRLQIIGISFDEGLTAPKTYVERNALHWVQGHLGAWESTDVPQQYGIWGIPQIILIGPDGRVIAKDLRDAAIMRAVQRALQVDS